MHGSSSLDCLSCVMHRVLKNNHQCIACRQAHVAGVSLDFFKKGGEVALDERSDLGSELLTDVGVPLNVQKQHRKFLLAKVKIGTFGIFADQPLYGGRDKF